ncbi:type IV toxin-antitoxin system AbiEi family antitoxin domain-containing protein [Bradyrhizobium yuanmingense]|uniref:type IV toxin-antitoxin system AbiEi family antitoxin domain-containing protein n=1 Tax=Bradyrhizobium yuanmingense TaxID=108015 RepID=UPI0018D23317|nr:hypothetical protein [Bradyrhizobium yuanmingense]
MNGQLHAPKAKTSATIWKDRPSLSICVVAISVRSSSKTDYCGGGIRRTAIAVAAKLIPNGVICYDSALAFHELTDRIPPYVWMAIGPRDWRPKITRPRIQITRFGSKEFDKGVERHTIEGVLPRSIRA